MKISKARLKQIINEEVQNYKRYIHENEFAGLPFDDDGEEEHEQVAIEKKRMVDSIEELLIHINPQQVVQHLQSLATQVEQGKISESINEGKPVMYPQELQTVVHVVEDVVEAGGDLTVIGDALEQAGLKIQRGYRYIMVFVKYAKIMIAPTSAVELEGNETVVGNFAVGEMQE